MKLHLKQLLESKMGEVKKEEEKLLKKCEEYKITPPTFYYSPTYTHEFKTVDIELTENMWGKNVLIPYIDGEVFEEDCFDLIVYTEESLSIPGGWKLVAINDHKSHLIRKIGEEKVPTKYNPHSCECEHCNKSIVRDESFILYSSQEDKWIQVGSTCLENFLGINPLKYIKVFQAISQLNDFIILPNGQALLKGQGGGFKNFTYPVEEVIKVVASRVKEEGKFIKPQYENFTRINKGESTQEFVSEYLEKVRVNKLIKHYNSTKEYRRLPNITPSEKEVVAYISWISSLSFNKESIHDTLTSTESWLLSIKNIVKRGRVRVSDLGQLISSYNTFLEEVEKTKFNFKNNFIGRIGEKIDSCKVTLVSKKEGVSEYSGYYSIIKFRNEEGNIIVYIGSGKFASSIQVGKSDYTIKFTVKEHNQYNGENQTLISRPSVVK